MNCKAFAGGSLLAVCVLMCTGAQAANSPGDAQAREDNTALKSDRNSEMATPVDQSNSADALQVTAAIRKAVVEDKSLSTSAHNVKIITNGNTVTLRGPVASTAEKNRIAALARQYAPGKDVLDQITVN